MKKSFACYFLILGAILSAEGNNLGFSDVQWINDSTLQLQIAWDNSWMDSTGIPANHDAVWIFAKVLNPGQSWEHLKVSSNLSSYSWNAGLLEVLPSEDGIGAFIRRKNQGSGDIAFTQIRLVFPEMSNPAQTQVRIFGIEMVYVNEGAYFLGDGGSLFRFRKWESDDPFWVADEMAIPVNQMPGSLSSDSLYSPFGAIPEGYPKGFQGFYAMKYEISQGQYRDFLNCLPLDQQSERMQADPFSPTGTLAMASSPNAGFRNSLVIENPANQFSPAMIGCDATMNGMTHELGDGENRAMNLLNWDDLAAYLDWSGLRPMTELEFEKACRGADIPVAREFAWGTASIIDANTTLNDGFPNESVQELSVLDQGLASHGYQGVQGPLRCGFGGNDSSNRLQSGAGYFGIKELSGNLWELCVGVDSAGLEFLGNHGDGILSENGLANEASWPTESGACYRGGAWNSGIIGEYRDLAVSDRFYSNLHPLLRRNTAGGRGVRSVSQ